MGAYRTYLQSLLTAGAGYWRVGEASAASPAADDYGSHPGTYVNTPTMGATGALAADTDTGITLASASSQYVDVAGFNTASAPWTIGGWAKMTATGFTLLADYKDATGGLLLDFTGTAGDDVAEHPLVREHAYGNTRLASLQMIVRADMAAPQLRDTLLHEVIHACLVTLGLDPSEELVRGLTPVLLDALRTNLDLTAWLMADSDGPALDDEVRSRLHAVRQRSVAGT